jgi:hypothetical protein
VAAVLPAVPLFAQSTITHASLSGRVVDPTGAVVPQAAVRATSRERGQAFAAVTDGQGRFRLLYLPVDTYDLVVAHPPLAPATRELRLAVGQALDLTVTLAVPEVRQAVEVTSEPPLVETVRTQIAETVTPAEVAGLPLNGRNYLDLAALSPAVTRSNPVSNQRFPETSAVPGTGLSIAGQRHINNGFVVDGLSANDDAADLAGAFFTQEVIREFQVITSGGIAEFGRAAAGTVNVLTRSGTNSWTGDGYTFFRDDALDAKNPLAPRKDPLRQWQYGASLAGPLHRDRTFLFANAERTTLDSSTVVTVSDATVDALNRRLEAVRYPGPRMTTGLARTGYTTTNLFARLDHRAGGVLLTARYSLYDIESPNARNVGGLNAESRGTALEDTDQTFALAAVVPLGARAAHETRLQYTRSRLGAPPNDDVGPAVTIAGVAGFGTATNSPTRRDLDLYELADVLTVHRGAHALKAGGDVLWNRLDIEFPGALQGSYTFSSLAAFQAGTYVTFQQAFGAASQFQSNPNLGLFLQDEWRAHRTLTLNAGLRYDVQFLSEPIATDADNVSPRLGVAWAPGDGRTVVRASAGLYFDRIPLRATSNALQRDGTRYRVAVVPFGAAGAPVFPSAMATFPEGLLASVTTIDPDIQASRTFQSSFQVERALGARASLAVGYLRGRGRGLILSRNVNVPTLTAAQAAARGIPNLGRPDPRFANVSRFESLGTSAYDGLTVSLRRPLAGWWGARVSYTLSRAQDDAGNAFFFSPQDSRDVHAEWGPSDNDQRHRLVASGELRLLGMGLSAIFSYGSPLPFNVTTSTDRNNDTNVNDRPEGVGRNSERGFPFASLDLRLSRRVAVGHRHSVELSLDAFNVLNRANLQLPNGVFGPGATPRAGFGQATSAADPRQVQLGLRARF